SLLVDWAENKIRRLLIELPIRAHPVYFRCGGEEHTFFMPNAFTHYVEVRFEIQLEHPERVRYIGRRRGNRHERNDDIAFADMILDPFFIDGDVALDEVKTIVPEALVQLVRGHVHAVDFPVLVFQNVFCETVANKAVDSEDQDFEAHELPLSHLLSRQESVGDMVCSFKTR